VLHRGNRNPSIQAATTLAHPTQALVVRYLSILSFITRESKEGAPQ
jgi:hypothetical protein